MKNIYEIMKEFGIEVPEDKRKDFDKLLLDNYKTINDYEKQTEKIENLSKTIETNDKAVEDLKKELEGFKGVDVSALNNRIKDLETEKATLETDFASKLADRDFSDILKDQIASASGKNQKAIMALLDMDALKASKNQKDDISAAIKALTEAEDSKMLFGTSEPSPEGTIDTAGKVTSSGAVKTTSLREALLEKYK